VRRFLAIAALVAFAGGCRDRPEQEAGGKPVPEKPAAPKPPPPPDPDALPEARDLPPDRRAIQVVHGVERTVDVEVARARGQTIVDLSDGWAPVIFQDATAADGALLPNRYRAVFVGLANDATDGDGQPLSAGEKNYLELYGIPPSLSVLRQRFLDDAARSCDSVDTTKLLAVEAVETWGATTEKKQLGRHAARAARLEEARVKAGVATVEELATVDPKLAREVDALRRTEAERAAFAELEKRLACEGLMNPAKHTAGSYDTAMRQAMLDFQQKNVLIAQADITRATLEAAARPLQENNFASLRRVLTERAAHAGGFIEDGSVNPPVRVGKSRRDPTYPTASGKRAPIPDLVGKASDALLARLGILTAADAVAFFQRHPAGDFRWLKVAVRFPPLPEYYSPHMDLSAEIDRGDVWYDFPYDDKGQRRPQPRTRYPSLTVFVNWGGEKVPLVRWRSTIGGWRAELASDGEEYFRYKDSDVGPRVWRHVVAAPVWIPPTSSPLGSMVKTKLVNGALSPVVNYDETGPGYLSAYGLVAAIHVEPRRRDGQIVGWFDNGIRTHGSSDYMSLRGRFSHGCHRLYNNLAVRLFSFVVQHRTKRTLGPMALDFRRPFHQKGAMFEMRLPTRGFYYELTPPIPVETLEGTVKGAAKKPIAGYLRKPGVTYASSAPPPAITGPDSKAGGGSGAEAAPPVVPGAAPPESP
jgi:hypothetical protein